jgi:hypothetical protein
MLSNPEGLQQVIRLVMRQIVEAEMDEAPGAGQSEHTRERPATALAIAVEHLSCGWQAGASGAAGPGHYVMGAVRA